MASITSIGVGSGIDLEGLVSRIISAERDPIVSSLDLKEANVQADISAFGSLKSTLSAFQTSLSNLKEGNFFQQQNATSGDSKLFTATSDGSAVLGSYDIAVLYEAKAHRLASTDFASPTTVVGSGTLAITSGSTSFNVNITAGSNDTLDDIRDAINDATGNEDGSVKASILTVDDGFGGKVSKLVLSAAKTGKTNEISITVTDDDLSHKDNSGLSQLFFNSGDPSNQMSETSLAQDAEITVDGFTAKSSTNTFADTIAGITINVLKGSENPLTPDKAALVISKDTSTIRSEVEKFVASYNELAIVLNELTDYDNTTQTRGLLMGDSTVTGIENQIRRITTGSLDQLGTSLKTLADLGITTNNKGLLQLDSDKLASVVSSNSDDFTYLFSKTANGEDGIATQLDSLLDTFLATGGIISTREAGFKERLSEIEDQRLALSFRLDKVEARFRSQFASLDILVSQLNSTGDFLTQQLDAAAKIINRKQ